LMVTMENVIRVSRVEPLRTVLVVSVFECCASVGVVYYAVEQSVLLRARMPYMYRRLV